MGSSSLLDSRFARIMQGHFKKATKDPDEYVIYAMDPDDCRKWYILIRNMCGAEDEWVGGHFLFEMSAPKTFPHDPPTFIAQHENGVYGVGSKCCISIGEYHKDQYRAVLGMRGFAQELCNGMMNHEYLTELGGINLLKTSTKHKKKVSESSLDLLHTKFPKQMKLLEDSFAVYTKKWKLDSCNNDLRRRLSFGSVQIPLKDGGESATGNPE